MSGLNSVWDNVRDANIACQAAVFVQNLLDGRTVPQEVQDEVHRQPRALDHRLAGQDSRVADDACHKAVASTAGERLIAAPHATSVGISWRISAAAVSSAVASWSVRFPNPSRSGNRQ
jgi:hypothetical protein